MTDKTTDTVLIIDFGSQVTQLIARRVREQGVYSEIVPFNRAEDALERLKPKAVILSGGPASVTEFGTPRAPDWVFKAGLPVLGICYGEQAMVEQMGGAVEGGHHREFGRAELEVTGETALFKDVWKKGERDTVWMSHGDRVTRLPPGFKVVGVSKGAPFAAIADEKRKLYAVQFHPEVAHTPKGSQLIGNFVRRIAGLPGDWSMAHFKSAEIAKIRAQVGKGRVICGLSGGVDSAVAAVLIHEAIGEQLTCIFVDHGLLRLNEAKEVVSLFRGTYNIPLVHIDARARFLAALAGKTDPEAKRKTIGALFIEVFDEEAKKAGGAEFLAQGTLYPDVIESVSFTGGPSVTIKSHHNVGGLPERMNLQADRAPARALQGRGAGAGPRAGPARALHLAPPVPRPRPGDPHPWRGDGGAPRDPAQGRRRVPRRDPQGRPLRQDLAGVRRAAAGAHRRRHGRRAHLRPRLRPARRHLHRRHDGRLLPVPARCAGPLRHPHHQRSQRHQPRRLRRDEQAAGHHRVGVRLSGRNLYVSFTEFDDGWH